MYRYAPQTRTTRGERGLFEKYNIQIWGGGVNRQIYGRGGCIANILIL